MNKEQQNNLKTNNQIEKNYYNESITQEIKKKRKSKTKFLKSNYSKACFILSKIKRNMLNGTPHENDEEDRKKYLAVVHEYEEYKKKRANIQKKFARNQELRFPKAEKQLEISKTDINSFQDKGFKSLTKTVNETKQNIGNTQHQLNKVWKKNTSATTTRRPSLDILNDELCLAVVNEIEGYFKPVNETDWSMINNKINEQIMNYLLRADSGIPRYSTGEIYWDYILIQCNDMFSKEFICNCVAKMRYTFDGMSLTLIPAARIPDVLKERFEFEKKVEPSPPPDHRNHTEKSNNSNFNQNQGFQLSVNYFKSDTEDSMKSSSCEEQMPDRASPYRKGSFESPDSKEPMPWEASINYSESSCGESMKSLDWKNPNFDQNQGFQLSVNYFESDSEDSMKSSSGREQMPNRASVDHFIADCKGSLKTPHSKVSAKRFEKKREHIYNRYKRKFKQLSETDELTERQIKLKCRSERYIRKYESMDLPMVRSFSPSLNVGSFHESDRENRTEFSQFLIANKNSNNYDDSRSERLNPLKETPSWDAEGPKFSSSNRSSFEPNKAPINEFPPNSGSEIYNPFRENPCRDAKGSKFSSSNRSSFEPNKTPINEFPPNSGSEIYNPFRENPCRDAKGSKFSSSNSSSFEPNKEPINKFQPNQQCNKMPKNPRKYDDPNTETRKYSGFWAQPSNFNNVPQSFSELNNENVRSMYERRVPVSLGAESPPSCSEIKGIPRLDTSGVSLISGNLFNQKLPSSSMQQPDKNQTLRSSINFPDDSTKSILEKHIYERLNVHSEGISAEITTKERETESAKAKDLIEPLNLSDTRPSVAQLKLGLNSVRKRISNLPVVEVISLIDDSDNSDVDEVKPTEKKMDEEECIKALEYLKNIQPREPSSLSQGERLQIEIYRHKVRKYKQMIGLEDQEGDIKTVENNSLQSTRVEVTSRNITSKNTFPNFTSEHQPDFRVTDNSNPKQTSETAFQLSKQSCISSTNQESSLNTSDSYESLLPISKTSPDLEFAIIDRNQEDFKIRTETWLKIEQNLLETLAREMEQTKNPNIGMFHGTYWRYGIKIVQCESMESLNFIKRFIYNQHIFWPNTEFDVIPVRDLPRRSIVKVWIPPPPMEDNAVLRILKAQNSKFYSLDWTLVNAHERNTKDGKDFYISISATSLERLRTANGQIRFGTNRLRTILPENESKGS